MREFYLPSGNGSGFETGLNQLHQSGNPQLALECWMPQAPGQQLEEQEVFCAFEGEPQYDSRTIELAGHILNYCETVFGSSTLANNGTMSAGQLPPQADRALRHIRRLLRQHNNPRELFDNAMDVVNHRVQGTGRVYTLNLNMDANTWVISGTYRDRHNGTLRNLDINMQIPPEAPEGPARPNPIATPEGGNTAATLGTWAQSFATRRRPGQGNDRSDEERLVDFEYFREAWRRQPPGDREPGGNGQAPLLVDRINTWITNNNIQVNGRPVRLAWHRPFDNGSEDYIQLVYTDQEGGNASPKIYVGTSDWTQVQARERATSDSGPAMAARWLQRAWDFVAPYVPYSGWVPGVLLPVLAFENYFLPTERRAVTNLIRGIGRRLGDGGRFIWNGPSDFLSWWRNTPFQFSEPSHVYSRSHVNVTGNTADARQQELDRRMAELRLDPHFQNNPLLDHTVLVNFQRDALQFADQLRFDQQEAQRSGTPMTAQDRVTRFQDFIRDWGRNNAQLTTEQRALFEHAHISVDVHSFTGTALATASVVTPQGGGPRQLRIVLPANLLSGNMTQLQINEALGSLYDACFRADAVERLGNLGNNAERLGEIRQHGNLLAYYLEHSMDHTLHLGDQANLARLNFDSSRQGLHTQHVTIEFRRNGTMVVRHVGGAEMTEAEVREMLESELEREVRSLTGRQLTTAEQERLRRLQELQRRLNGTETERREARRLLHEHLRERYAHHQGRTGGSRVAWGMIIDEALTLVLRAIP